VNTSTLQNPGHTYDTVGVYSVNLTVANSYSSSSLVRTGYINVTQPPPTAYIINLTPTSGIPPLTVSWLGLASNAPILSWLWNFGDGSPTVTTQNANHTFTSSGTYNVSLTATNAGGSGTAYQLITVYYIPTFSSITPSSGSTLGGTPVTIVGTNFADGGAFGVTIGGAAATSVVRVNSTHITAVTPAGTVGARDVVITNNGGQTATGTGAYTYVALPTFSSITPNSGPPAGGTPVTIVGTNFVSGGLFGVTIGGNPATSVVRVNATHITAVTPAGTLGAKNVVITNNDGQTATGFGAFTYVTPPPTFTTITPASGPTAGVTPVTIVGGNFVSGGSFGVTIGGVAATNVTLVDASHITASTPAGTAGAKNVVITNNDGQTATGTNAYTYVAPPTFTSITPNFGTSAGGTPVTITGGNFVSGGSFGVTIGGVAATSVVRVDASTITAVTPAGSAGPKNVVITNNDGQTATGAGAYTYYTILSFTTVGTTPWTVPSGVTTVEYLVVAGGGGGGRYGGGGGAGGFRTGTLTGLTGSQTVTVGGGGAGATSSTTRGSNGGNSVFASITSTGGGGGGSSGAAGVYSGAAGGSGGGGARQGGAGGAGTAGQGNNGGAGARTTQFTGGGGGGAGAVGGTATTSTAGSGGAGTASSITDVSVTYAGGGGGGCNSARTAGGGGAGGGGAGGDGAAGTAGTNGLGGGGGGSGTATTAAGAGGSGIVIIRFY
jgi:PKD repeat protein